MVKNLLDEGCADKLNDVLIRNYADVEISKIETNYFKLDEKLIRFC
jgi:hypothetical protein